MRKIKSKGWRILFLAGFCFPALAMKDVSVCQYGARGNDHGDDTVAFQKALDDVMAAGGGTIYVPPGDYIISKRLEVKTPGNHPALKLAIRGEGVDTHGSRLMSTSPDGLLYFYASRNQMDLTVRNLALMAGRPDCGIALAVHCQFIGGVRVERAALIENVLIDSIYDDSYFTKGISLYGLWRPLLRNVTVRGARSDSLADDSPAFGMQIGIQQDAFYAGQFIDCHVSNCHTAYSWVAAENGEGFVLIDCTADKCRIGAVIATPEQEPGGALTRCRFRARDIGLRVDHKRLMAVTGNEFRPLSDCGEYRYYDVCVSNSWAIQINRNRFSGSPMNRTHVRIDGRGDAKEYVIMPFTRFIQVNENQMCLPPEKAVEYVGDDIFGVYLERNIYGEEP